MIKRLMELDRSVRILEGEETWPRPGTTQAGAFKSVSPRWK